MTACVGCGTDLPGRRQKCDRCKAVTGRPAKKATPKKRAARRAPAPAKPTAKKAPASKTTPPRPPRSSSPAPTAPTELGARGRALWKVLDQDPNTGAGVLALEACRLADRCDDLDRIIHGKGVLQLLTFRLDHVFAELDIAEVKVKVEFSNVLAEARQQQNALRQVLNELGVSSIAEAPPAPPPAATSEPSNALDELTARRQSRVDKKA